MNTKFDKANFTTGEYLMYGGVCGTFIARFKYNRKDRAGFVSFLVKNFAVEEYQAALNAGRTPLEILQSKGYISATIKSMLKAKGYAPTAAGLELYHSARQIFIDAAARLAA